MHNCRCHCNFINVFIKANSIPIHILYYNYYCLIILVTFSLDNLGMYFGNLNTYLHSLLQLSTRVFQSHDYLNLSATVRKNFHCEKMKRDNKMSNSGVNRGFKRKSNKIWTSQGSTLLGAWGIIQWKIIKIEVLKNVISGILRIIIMSLLLS